MGAGMRYQPQGRIRLNRANPLTRDIDVAFVDLGQPGLVDPAALTKTNNPSKVAAPYGLGWYFGGAGSDSFSSSAWPAHADGTEYTYLVVVQISAIGSLGFIVNDDNAIRAMQFRVEDTGAPTIIGFNAAGGVSAAATGSVIQAGVTQAVAVRSMVGSVSVFQDGARTAHATHADTIKGSAGSNNIIIGTRLGANLKGSVGLLIRWPRALSDSEAQEATIRPWQLFQALEEDDDVVAAGVGSYTLTADSGSYVLTGIATALTAARQLAAESATFSISGSAVGLNAARRLGAESDAYALNGVDVTLKSARLLMAAPGAFSLTSGATDLRGARMLAAATASFTLTGVDVDMRATRRLAAEAGSFSLAGNAAGLTYTPNGAVLIAQTGAFAINGAAVGLKADRRLAATTGNFAVLGSAVGLAADRHLVAESGSIVITGGAASLNLARRLGASQGSYLITGFSVNFAQVLVDLPESRIYRAPAERRIFRAPAERRIYRAN